MGSISRSKYGRWGSTAAASIAALGFSGAYLLPHLFPDNFLKLTASYRFGERLSLSEDMKDLVKEVSHDTKLSHEKINSVEPYLTDSPELLHGGVLVPFISKCKFVLGLPATYNVESKEEMPRMLLKGVIRDVDINSELGKQISESCHLSEKGKKFGIAQTIYKGDSHEHLFQFFLTSTVLFSNIFLCKLLNKKFDLFEKRGSIRFTIYPTSIFFSWIIVSWALDSLSLHYQLKADRLAATISPAYAEGGVEFYHKLIQRNKAFTHIEITKRFFTQEGNENRIFFQRNKPTVRLAKLLKVIHEENRSQN